MCPHCEAFDAHEDGCPVGEADRILGESSRWWNLDHPLPWPRPALLCGSHPTEGPRWLVRRWRFHLYEEEDTGTAYQHRVPWRCSVSLKCLLCGATPPYGIPIPEDYYREALRLGLSNVAWYQARDHLRRWGLL